MFREAIPTAGLRTLALCLVAAGALAERAFAQLPSTLESVTLRGTVRDVSGAVMQAVVVRVFDESDTGSIAATATEADGRFAVMLPAGVYRVEVTAPGFAPFDRVVTVAPGSPPLEVVLDLDLIALAVDVTPADELAADTATSLTATTLAGDDLLDLPRNEEDLIEHLLLLAGADVTGDLDEDRLAHFIIDGFEDGRMPSPDQIAQIVIDPDSLRADGSGRPRIEIVTRPGSGRWRGSVDVGFADASLNARTPGEPRKEPRQTRDVELRLEGPLVADRLEVTAELSTRHDERAGDSLRAVTPFGNVFSGVVQPEREHEIAIGARLQLNPRHRLDVRFTGSTQRSHNRTVGGFRLPERGSDGSRDDWTFEIRERTMGANLTNNIRLRISRRTARQDPVRDGYAIDVVDAFMGGGGTTRSRNDDLDVRLDDTLRWARGAWSVEWGGRLQYSGRRSLDQNNYNGTFEFSSLHDYCVATAFAGDACAATERIVGDAVAGGVDPGFQDARGREIRMTGAPTTFTQAFGRADLHVRELSFNSHVQADRRFGRAASLGVGLRYEATNHSRDFLRLDPTVNLQYRLTDRTVVNAGSRLSFRDFTDYERLLRNDGSTRQRELSISSPSFPDPFQGGTREVNEDTASMWVLDSDYRSPYSVTPQVSVTQQVPGDVRLTLSYSASYGYRERRTRNINAPYPGTPLPDALLDLPRGERLDIVDRMRPLYPYVGNVTQIESTGRSASRILRLQVQPRRGIDAFGLALSGNVNYAYRSAGDDNDFDNPYLPQWGPTRRDHEIQSRFRIALRGAEALTSPLLRALAQATWAGAQLNFSLRANTGRLYSIRSGRDLNGDQSSRDRPPGVARNTETGPANWNVDMTLTKDLRPWSRGTEAAGRGSRTGDGPRVRVQARVRNLLNHTQVRGYGSVVTSPLFGLPTGYHGGRTVNLSMRVEY